MYFNREDKFMTWQETFAKVTSRPTYETCNKFSCAEFMAYLVSKTRQFGNYFVQKILSIQKCGKLLLTFDKKITVQLNY